MTNPHPSWTLYAKVSKAHFLQRLFTERATLEVLRCVSEQGDPELAQRYLRASFRAVNLVNRLYAPLPLNHYLRRTPATVVGVLATLSGKTPASEVTTIPALYDAGVLYVPRIVYPHWASSYRIIECSAEPNSERITVGEDCPDDALANCLATVEFFATSD